MILASMILLLAVTMNAQDLKSNAVPKSFNEGLLKSYPTATNIEWEKSGTDYKVEFDVGRMDHKIWFNKDGDMVKVRKNITSAQVPTNLKEIIKRDYPNYKIDSVESVEMGEDVIYKVELEKSWNESIIINFNTNGQILRAMRN